MRKVTGIAFGFVFLLFVFLACTFQVQETEKSIVLRLGKIKLDAVGEPITYAPGLHFKMPMIDRVKPFKMWLRTLNVDASRTVTVEQKYVMVDSFVKWHVKDIVKFYKSTTGLDYRAENLLTQKLNDALRSEFGKHTIEDLVSGQRTNIMSNLQRVTNEVAQSLGVEIIDVRIKAIELPLQVQDSVFARMRSDRVKEAEKIRAEGEGMAERIRAEADAKAVVMLAEAETQSAQLRADGQASAASIYAEAFSQDPRFYKFLKSLQSYEGVFRDHHGTLVVQPKGRFFEYFQKSLGE